MCRLYLVSTFATVFLYLLWPHTTAAWPAQAPTENKAVELNRQGIEHFRRKEYDAAIKSFRDALEIEADYPEALDNLGKALTAVGKDAEAIEDFQKAIKLAPDNAIAYNDMGHALFHEKRYEESAASYRQAISIHDDYPTMGWEQHF